MPPSDFRAFGNVCIKTCARKPFRLLNEYQLPFNDVNFVNNDTLDKLNFEDFCRNTFKHYSPILREVSSADIIEDEDVT